LSLLYHALGQTQTGFKASRFVRGGLGRLIDVLAQVAQTHGAEIRTGAEVAQILVNDDRATGVRLADGETISASRVISSADPRRTFFDLVGAVNLPVRFVRRVRAMRFRGCTARVNLALRDLPSFNGQTEAAQLGGHIIIAPSLEYLERAYDAAKYGSISTHPYLEAVIPTALDPSLAPDGQHTMSITMQYAPYHLRDGTWADQGETLGDQIVQTLAAYAPGLSDLILARQVITPLDWEQIYGLTEGSLTHGEMQLDQMLMMRPVPGYGQYRTPIENLYLCGAGTHPGGGITGAPGFNAARQILCE
jgi:phytoene dehydrogenase-like protein